MSYSAPNCFRIVNTLEQLQYIYLLYGKESIISTDDASQLYFACKKEREAEYSDQISRPMVWIGIFIAAASLLCIIAMTADLLHGFRNKKFWFPCTYFSLNAASITVIAITMKLPIDLTSPMSYLLNQETKLGSLAFLCVMMVNLMPSLASMDNKTLLTNVAGLSILVITVVVNICIQIHTGAVFVVTDVSNDLDNTYVSRVVGETPYKWSMFVIYLTQSLGVIVGTIAPLSRCFIILNFNFTIEWNMKHLIFFRVERYRTQKLNEWKESNICFLSSNRTARRLICTSKNIVLCVCIGFQKVTIISCKVLCVIVAIFPIIAIRYSKSLNTKSFTPHITSGSDVADEDLTSYALQIDNETVLSKTRLKRITGSVKSFISKAEKEQNNNLLKLLAKSTGFEGVLIFDTDQVPRLLSNEVANSWTLPIVTLTCIAISLPNIPNDAIESLLSSVGEGLLFTHLVEEGLNCLTESVNLLKVSTTLWHEMEIKCMWLGNPLSVNVFKGKTTTEIVKWFGDKSKEIMDLNKKDTTTELVDTSLNTLIAANSMYRATQTILLRFRHNVEPVSKKQLFVHLNGIIADILCACFTNIPRVITMKYQERVIEKREASVKVAAKLLGKTTKIIEIVEKRELPSMDDDKMAYIDEWRLYFKKSVP